MAELLRYKVQIKEWEKQFAQENGRVPSKADVKANKEIRLAYKIYNELKKPKEARKPPHKDKGPETPRKKAGKTKEKDPGQLETLSAAQDASLAVVFSDEETHVSPVHNAELGPTPQANGKVLSLFDLVLSPPQSSPVKTAKTASISAKNDQSPAKNVQNSAKNDVFRTPTRAPRHIQPTLTPARGTSLSEKLRMAASPSADAVAETPFYLGKVNNKFSFSRPDYSPENSPVKRKSVQHSAVQTPEKPEFQTPKKPDFQTPEKSILDKSAENFQVSPSPLKSQRYLSFGSARRACDIFQDYQKIALDEDFEAQKREFEAELELQKQTEPEPEIKQEPVTRKRKALTQKRTTRRWKIKPRAEDGVEPGFEKDVHQEMERIDQEQRSALEKYMGSESSEEISEDESLPVVHKNPSTKLTAVSHNYQRLKINDPRAKKFKQRMRRR